MLFSDIPSSSSSGIQKRFISSPFERLVSSSFGLLGGEGRIPRSSRVLVNLPSMPPSIIKTWPVTWLDTVEDAETKIWFATSNGVAIFFSGVLRIGGQTDQPPIHRDRDRGSTHVANAL